MFDKTLPLPKESTIISGHQNFSAGHHENQGIRTTMEDSMAMIGDFAGVGTQFYAVYDGHGGREVADYLAHNLHRVLATKLQGINPKRPNTRGTKGVDEVSKAIQDAFIEVDTYASNHWRECGATAAVVIILGDEIWTANLGDARAVLDEGGKPRRLTVDHKPSYTEEKNGIIQRGGLIIQGRVNGILAVSRAFGDGSLKPIISNIPTIQHFRRNPLSNLIIACDGVWDVMDDETAVQFTQKYKNPTTAAKEIVNESLRRGTTDNVSVAVISLNTK